MASSSQLLSRPFPVLPSDHRHRHRSIPYSFKIPVFSSKSPSRLHRRRSVNLAASVLGSGSFLWAAIGAGGALVAAAMAASMSSSATGKTKAQQASLCVKRGMELFVQVSFSLSLSLSVHMLLLFCFSYALSHFLVSIFHFSRA